MKRFAIWLFFLTFFSCSNRDLSGVEKEGQLPFSVPTIQEGPITIKLGQVPYLQKIETRYTLTGTIVNSASEPISCSVRFYSVDTITAIDSANQNVQDLTVTVEVPAGGETPISFSYRANSKTYQNVHYPLHVEARFSWKGKDRCAHAVRVLETDLPQTSVPMKRTVIERGGVSLIGKGYRASVQLQGQKETLLGENWSGRDSKSRASVTIAERSFAGEMRTAYRLHPPYPRVGPLFLIFPVRLPDLKGLLLTWQAFKEPLEKKGSSDGVSFRVWAKEKNERKLLDEIHIGENSSEDRTFSLDPWRGKEIDLIFEVNPGPKNNPNFDNCALGTLLISTDEQTILNVGEKSEQYRYRFPLTEGRTAMIEMGPNGFLDAKITIGKGSSRITFSGLRIALDALYLDDRAARFTKPPEIKWDAKIKKLSCRYSLLYEDNVYEIELLAYSHQGMLVIEVPENNPERIGLLQLKASDQSPKRIYFGHGYVTEDFQKPIRLSGGGHGLSTSHVGFEYENGLSILLGSSMAPNALVVDPEKKTFSLEITDKTKLALLPCLDGPFAAAKEYRETAPWIRKPSKGVARKQGRFVFDVWGGSAKEQLETLKCVFSYGVTDILFFYHNWQRWGYDVRLPDVWAPDTEYVVHPRVGSIQELRELAEFCHKYDVPFGLHDNYIDFYPDADDFSYEKYISFMRDGQPLKAWLNPGRARAYKFRPDMIKAFIERNFKIGHRYLPTMDACFLDVFSATNIVPCYRPDGSMITRSEVAKYWGNAFEMIGEYLAYKDENGNVHTAITASEAGDDFLIGQLDGADAQWIRIDSKPGDSRIYFPCGDWERVPWFAMVNHTNYSRHGAGYESRYSKERSKNYYIAQGSYSDDYMTSEVMGGLDLMLGRDLVSGSTRKNYLLQHVMRNLCNKEITSFEFDRPSGKENIHRMKTIWSDGTVVYANRSKEDWTVAGKVLPPYSYLVLNKKGDFLSGIYRDPNCPESIVEASEHDGSFYLNGRGKNFYKKYDIEPKLVKTEKKSDLQFIMHIDWLADRPLPVKASVFIHITSNDKTKKIIINGGYKPKIPTDRWGLDRKGLSTKRVATGEERIMNIPKDLQEGSYPILVGIYDVDGNGTSYSLNGNDEGGHRYRIGDLIVKRKNGKLDWTIQPVPFVEKKGEQCEDPILMMRYYGNRYPFEYKGVATKGAVVVTPGPSSWSILPLPVMRSFEIELDEKKIGRKIASVELEGKPVELTRCNGTVVWTAEPMTARRVGGDQYKMAQRYTIHFAN